MYSILASKSCVPSHLPKTGVIADLKSIPWDSFLLCQDDISIVKGHLNVLICRLRTKFFHDLAPYAKFIPDHYNSQVFPTNGYKMRSFSN